MSQKNSKVGDYNNIVAIIIVEKRARAQNPTTWSPTTIKEVGDKFHQNF
jgi:hypothetical protein